MAEHTEPAGLSREVIGDYFAAVDLCLDARKADGGCLGYPAALLLFCIVNARGKYVSQQPNSAVPDGEPFYFSDIHCSG